jgi:hypothetical protein
MATYFNSLLLAFSLCHRAGALLPTRFHDTITSRHIMMAATYPLDSQRERISSENIFFIELGFGNDSHGQVGGWRPPFLAVTIVSRDY